MITIEINKKKVQIPTSDQLTVEQYIKFTKTKMNLINYLSICLGVEYKEAFDLKIKNLDMLTTRIGHVKHYSEIKALDKLVIQDKLYFKKNIEISTVGQRFMIEENAKKLENEELFCFILAVGIVKNPMNINEIRQMKNKLMQEPYINILPIGFFLARRFLIGKKKGINFLAMLRHTIKTKDLTSRRA